MLAAKFFSINVLYQEKTKINEKETGNGTSLKKNSIEFIRNELGLDRKTLELKIIRFFKGPRDLLGFYLFSLHFEAAP